MNTVAPLFVEALRDASVFTPELPQEDAFRTLERVRAYEHELIIPTQRLGLLCADYGPGTAQCPDELRIFNTQNRGVLTSADHATDPVRKATGIREGADHGTGGLVRLLAERDGTTAIVPVGMQTGNAAVTPGHPVKRTMDSMLPDRPGFLSVHGMRPGKLEVLSDKTEIHAIIGLGRTPNEESRAAAEAVVASAKKLGLRAIIGNDTYHQTYNHESDALDIDPQTGQPKQGRLAALGIESTTNHAYRVMGQNGISGMPAFQIEMTRLLRLLPEDLEQGWHVDKKSRAMGVHLGYLLVQAAVDKITAQY